MTGINSHLFYLSTLRLQNEAVSSALEQACTYLGQTLTAAKAGRFSRQICQGVYKAFENKISSEFSSADYQDLVSLTLKSRTNFFFVELQGRVKNLILGIDSTDSSEAKL